MFELRELSGQEYVDRYAKRKETPEAGQPARIGHLVPVVAEQPVTAAAGVS
jgi:hypothetical protein